MFEGNDDRSSWPDCPPEFTERVLNARDEEQNMFRPDQVERRVGERQRLNIALPERDIREALILGDPPRVVQVTAVQVETNDSRVRMPQGKQSRHRARPAPGV